jgi:hypothetical protein
MGELANAALAAGAAVVGVIPESLMRLEVGHRDLTELHVVRTMHERKQLMAERAHAFIALPRRHWHIRRALRSLDLASPGVPLAPDRSSRRIGLLRRARGIPGTRRRRGLPESDADVDAPPQQ